jgi:hypothetical protein
VFYFPETLSIRGTGYIERFTVCFTVFTVIFPVQLPVQLTLQSIERAVILLYKYAHRILFSVGWGGGYSIDICVKCVGEWQYPSPPIHPEYGMIPGIHAAMATAWELRTMHSYKKSAEKKRSPKYCMCGPVR